jgi:hypothetical protein
MGAGMIRLPAFHSWRDARHWLSIQLHGAMLLYLAVYSIMPALDTNIAHLLPTPFQTPVMGGYALLGILFRMIQQRERNG